MCTKNHNHMMYMVPEIRSATDRIFCHYGPFFALYPPQDIIILQMSTINDNHMMYGSWDMERDGQNFLSLWTIFCPFTRLTTQKIKILQKWKKCLEISSFYTCVPKKMITWCRVPEIWCATDGQTDGKWHKEVGVPPKNCS